MEMLTPLLVVCCLELCDGFGCFARGDIQLTLGEVEFGAVLDLLGRPWLGQACG